MQKNQVCEDTGHITLILRGLQTPPALPQVCSNIRAPLKCLPSSSYSLKPAEVFLSLPLPNSGPSFPACMLPHLSRTSNLESLETIPEEPEDLRGKAGFLPNFPSSLPPPIASLNCLGLPCLLPCVSRFPGFPRPPQASHALSSLLPSLISPSLNCTSGSSCGQSIQGQAWRFLIKLNNNQCWSPVSLGEGRARG